MNTYNPPPPPKRNNGLWIGIGVCGGCLALVAVFVVILGMLGAAGFRTAKQVTASLMQTTEVCETFLTDIKAHSYDKANASFSANGKQNFPSATLQEMAETLEKKNGALKTWTMAGSQTHSNNGAATLEYTYALHYEKGEGIARFTFHRNLMKEGTSQIDAVEMEQGAPDASPPPIPKEAKPGTGNESEGTSSPAPPAGKNGN